MTAPDLTCTDCGQQADACRCPRGPRFADPRAAWYWAERELSAVREDRDRWRVVCSEARETASTLALLLEAVVDRLTPEEAAEAAQAMERAMR